MKNIKNGFGLIGIVILVTFLVLGGILVAMLFLHIKHPNESTNLEPTSTSYPRNSIVKVDTTGWQTYTDDQYKFTLLYPPKLLAKAESHEPIGEQLWFSKDGSSNDPSFIGILYHAPLGKTIDQDFDELYNLATGSAKEINNPVNGHQRLTKLRNIYVHGMRAFEYQRNSLPINTANPEVGYGSYIDLGDNILVLEASEDARRMVWKMGTTVSRSK